MEWRRLAIISSHLRPPPDSPRSIQQPNGLSTSSCSCHGGGVDQAGGSSGEKPCVFCSIVRGESPAFKIYEDDISLCILDSNPLSYGHSLVIPKSHFPSLQATPPHVVAAMSSKLPFLSNAIMKATQCDSFNLLVNSGSAAGQVIFHTHFHIIPRKAGDELWPSESFRRQPIKWNKETVNLVDCIRDELSPLCNNCCRANESVLLKNFQE